MNKAATLLSLFVTIVVHDLIYFMTRSWVRGLFYVIMSNTAIGSFTSVRN